MLVHKLQRAWHVFVDVKLLVVVEEVELGNSVEVDVEGRLENSIELAPYGSRVLGLHLFQRAKVSEN